MPGTTAALGAAYTANATTVTVTSTAGATANAAGKFLFQLYPATGSPFYVIATGRTATTFTGCTAPGFGPAPAACAKGTQVTWITNPGAFRRSIAGSYFTTSPPAALGAPPYLGLYAPTGTSGNPPTALLINVLPPVAPATTTRLDNIWWYNTAASPAASFLAGLSTAAGSNSVTLSTAQGSVNSLWSWMFQNYTQAN